MTDDAVLQKAVGENLVIITNDKDFGMKIYRDRKRHKGVIFLRLSDERSSNKIRVLEYLLDHYQNHISDQFVVVTDKQVRFAKS